MLVTVAWYVFVMNMVDWSYSSSNAISAHSSVSMKQKPFPESYRALGFKPEVKYRHTSGKIGDSGSGLGFFPAVLSCVTLPECTSVRKC